MQLFYAPTLLNGDFLLDENDSKHCVAVLRHSEGDLITLADGQGTFYEAQITQANPKRCAFQVLRTWPDPTRPPAQLHIAIAPPKNMARFEWFLEKATEIGISEITPLIAERSERAELRLDRLEKVMIAAMKQTLKATLPRLNPPRKFNALLADVVALHDYPVKCIAYVNPQNELFKHTCPPHKNVLVLIGPEGDFSPAEVQKAVAEQFVPVSLGHSVLRVETAGIVVCTTVQLTQQIK